MKIHSVAFYAALVCSVTVAVAQELPKPAPDYAAMCRRVVTQVSTKQYDQVEAQFDAQVAAALPHGKLEEGWEQLISEVGPLQSIGAVQVNALHHLQVVILTCEFEKARLYGHVGFDAGARIGTISFTVVPPKGGDSSWTPSDYAKPGTFREQPLTVTDGRWELPGTLTLPAGDGKYRAVVLVQGSGPHDADETIGPNNPFKDLAWGLASRGVAVFRYTKRTFKYRGQSGADPAAFIVKEETMDDARAAVALLASQPQIDAKHIYLLGHSLGAYLAPRIATGDAQISGIILLAGNTRPMEQLVIEQVRHEVSKDGSISAEGQKQIDAAAETARQIDSPDLKAGTRVDFLGVSTPASYWLDLRGYQPGETAAKLKIPMLILQGERDYQVGVPDFEGWKKALASHANVTFRLYPALNHLFMAGSGPSHPIEYMKPGHVSADVVGDIAAWLLATSGKAK